MQTSCHFPRVHHTFSKHTSDMTAGYLILLAGVYVALGAVDATPWDQFVILTLAGSIVASSVAFLLNPTREPPRIVMGRAIFSCVAGVVGTRFAAHKIQWVSEALGGDLTLIFGAGFGLGMIGFLLAYAFIRSASTRSQKFVDGKFDKYLGDSQEVDPDRISHAASDKRKRR